MKMKALTALLISSVLATSAIAANYSGPVAPQGGYTGPGGPSHVANVAQAKQARDDTKVVLEGRITQRLPKHERYEFTDSSGSITVEIDDDDWPIGQTINENTKVRIYGEVDKDFFSTEIDVDYLQIIQ